MNSINSFFSKVAGIVSGMYLGLLLCAIAVAAVPVAIFHVLITVPHQVVAAWAVSVHSLSADVGQNYDDAVARIKAVL